MLSKSQHFETNGPLEGKKSLFKNDSDICMNWEMVVNNEQDGHSLYCGLTEKNQENQHHYW